MFYFTARLNLDLIYFSLRGRRHRFPREVGLDGRASSFSWRVFVHFRAAGQNSESSRTQHYAL